MGEEEVCVYTSIYMQVSYIYLVVALIQEFHLNA